MATEPQILSSFSPRACPRCRLTCFLSLPPMLANLLFCRGPGILPLPSTSVENSLQISLFLCKTNPILSAVGGLQMNVSSILTRDYENIANWTLGQNKPNSNPIQTQFKPNQTQLPQNQNVCNLTCCKGL